MKNIQKVILAIFLIMIAISSTIICIELNLHISNKKMRTYHTLNDYVERNDLVRKYINQVLYSNTFFDPIDLEYIRLKLQYEEAMIKYEESDYDSAKRPDELLNRLQEFQKINKHNESLEDKIARELIAKFSIDEYCIYKHINDSLFQIDIKNEYLHYVNVIAPIEQRNDSLYKVYLTSCKSN